MAYNKLPILKVYQMGNRVFSHDVKENFQLRTLEEEIRCIGKEMLYFQQKIWDLDEEIRINEGKEQLLRILRQNELRKAYSDLKQQKEALQSGKIKPSRQDLTDCILNGYQFPSIDAI